MEARKGRAAWMGSPIRLMVMKSRVPEALPTERGLQHPRRDRQVPRAGFRDVASPGHCGPQFVSSGLREPDESTRSLLLGFEWLCGSPALPRHPRLSHAPPFRPFLVATTGRTPGRCTSQDPETLLEAAARSCCVETWAAEGHLEIVCTCS